MQYEIIRKSLLADPSSGGLIRLVADKPAYLPSSGSDYVFSPLDYWRGCLFTRAELVLASLFDALEANARRSRSASHNWQKRKLHVPFALGLEFPNCLVAFAGSIFQVFVVQNFVSAGALGVGIREMRERLRQLGGTLDINFKQPGHRHSRLATGRRHLFDSHGLKVGINKWQADVGTRRQRLRCSYLLQQHSQYADDNRVPR